MNKKCFVLPSNRLRRAGARMMQAAAMALLVALAIPARAADARAVKMRVSPVYPVIAQRMKITGIVHLSVTVDAEGKVTDVKDISGNRALSEAAQEAVRKWKFAPGDGASTVDVAVTFALQ
jgi:TonB family protein